MITSASSIFRALNLPFFKTLKCCHTSYKFSFMGLKYHFLTESPKESKSGVAYDVILAPATNAEGTPRPASPPKERPLSQEIIDKKLEDAEKRRLVSI